MMRRPLVSTAMMSAPMTVPMIEPLPPCSDVPPMTTAAIASSSSPGRRAGCAELQARRDQHAGEPDEEAGHRVDDDLPPTTLTPDSAVASSLLPIEKV